MKPGELEQLLFTTLIGTGVIALLAYPWIKRSYSGVQRVVRRFFGIDPSNLPVVTKQMSHFELPNIEVAIRNISNTGSITRKTIGYTNDIGDKKTLREILSASSFGKTQVASVQYRSFQSGPGEFISAVENGIHLFEFGGQKIVVHVRTDDIFGRSLGTVGIEVLAQQIETCEAFLRELEQQLAVNNIYRGKIISLSQPKEDEKAFGGVNIVFHQFPHITPDQIVLPEETRQVIERNTVGFFKNIEPLRASGQSLKRGVLLFGKPGTGKTFTAKWLAQAIPDLTVILLSGDQLWHITHACQSARMLAPSLVIMEDVDLIAAERDERKHPMYQVTLHQLMNEMDGLSSEVPVLFLLTTNRPDAIESAIASRPGRVDQAIEYPLPDPGCRRKLIDLYGSGMVLRLDRQDEWMARTDGASPAFIKEWLRKAAMIAIEKGSMEGGRALVTDDHAESAIRELIFFGGSVTRELLGFSAEQQDA